MEMKVEANTSPLDGSPTVRRTGGGKNSKKPVKIESLREKSHRFKVMPVRALSITHLLELVSTLLIKFFHQ